MSDFKDLYKNQANLSHQQSLRRKLLLEKQRERRENKFNECRDIKTPDKIRTRINYEYRDNLMLSEWMFEAPDDIEDFLLIACPKGKRVTLSNENNKKSRMYAKNGSEIKLKQQLRTNLPKNTILDCIYSKSSKTIYVLDLICYDGRDFMNCDTSFRLYWIKTKFLDDEIKIYENDDELKFKLIESYDFSEPNAVFNCFQTHPIFEDGDELDGFLFYHKEADYIIGTSPCVLWLFSFMIEDVIPMFRVHPYYNSQKPDDYTTYLKYIEDFNEKLNSSKKRRSRKVNDSMETQEVHINEEFECDEMQKMIDLERFGDFE